MRGLRNLIDDSVGCPGRSEQPYDLLRDETGKPLFNRGGQFRHTNQRGRADHGENAQLARFMEFEHLAGHGRYDHRNLSADQVGERRPGAAIGLLSLPWPSMGFHVPCTNPLISGILCPHACAGFHWLSHPCWRQFLGHHHGTQDPRYKARKPAPRDYACQSRRSLSPDLPLPAAFTYSTAETRETGPGSPKRQTGTGVTGQKDSRSLTTLRMPTQPTCLRFTRPATRRRPWPGVRPMPITATSR